MIVRTSAKSRLMRPGTVMRSVMPWTPFLRMSSAILKASIMLVRFSATCKSLSLGMMMRESTFSLRRLMPSSAYVERLRPSKANGLRDDPDGQRSRVPGYLGDDRGGARAGPATLAGRDEDHVGPAQRLLDLRLVLLGGLHPDLRVRAGAEAARDLLPYVDLLVGITHLEGLGVRVYRYELNPLQTGVDHAVHGVGPPTANADNLYDRQIISRRVQHAFLTLHHTFSEGPPVYLPRNQPLTASTMLPKLRCPCTFTLRSRVTVSGREV